MFGEKYLKSIVNIRYLILFFIGISTIFFVYNIDSQSISNDEKEWIQGSSEHNKLLDNEQSEFLGKTVKVYLDIENINGLDFLELQNIHEYLTQELELENSNTFFNHLFSLKIIDDDSSFVELTTLADSENSYLVFKENQEEFAHYFTEDSIIFYIFAKDNFKIENIPTGLDYTVENLFSSENMIEESVLLIALALILTTLLAISFKSFSAPIIGIIFIFITSSATIYIFKLFMGSYTPHISILILSFSISFMDFLYIYYRWFIFQQKKDSFESIHKTVQRTFAPIFFTTIVNILGIGSLIFVDSNILQSLGLMVIISSIVGLIYSFLFLPLILSFVKRKSPTLKAEKFSLFFSKKIMEYNPIALKIFGVLTFLLVLISLYQLGTGTYHVTSKHSSKIIKLSLDYDEINIESMKTVEKLSNLLKIDEVEKIDSAFQMIKALYQKESKLENCKEFNLDNIEFDRYIFLLDMFGEDTKIFSDGKVKIDIYLKDSSSKSRVLNILNNSGIEIFFTDVDTLLQSAKIETINIIVILIILILFVISVIIFIMTKNVFYSIIGMVVGVTPIAWFFSGVTLLNYPVSTEMFVAMIISVAISSDATIHLLHYYYKLDSEKRFDEDGIHRLFLYIESPLILGNIILATTFILMIIANIYSIILIGVFSAIIVMFSLFTDIFILPVIILESRKFLKKK